jgi:ABC-type dipeptide/oligopeptide/nickel transport system permease subunit
MPAVSVPKNEAVVARPAQTSELRRIWRVLLSRKLVVFGLVIIFLLLVAVIFAPLLTPYDPYKTDLKNTLAQPSWSHPLGTDEVGRDTWTRLLFGSRISLLIGLVVVTVAAVAGTALGALAGYYEGWVGSVIMRVTDSVMSIPMILLAMVVAALLGGGVVNVMIALALGLIPSYARLMHGQVLTVKQNDYILAERAIGSRSLHVMVRHLLPNCLPQILVVMAMMLGGTILAEAALSFLGIGIKQPTPAWGSMVNDGRFYLETNPVLCFAPGVAVMLVVFAFNMLGDGLRDALDPRLRGTI